MVAMENMFCRGCGIKFTEDHVKYMKTHFHIPLNVAPWNVRDRFRCIKCDSHVSTHDAYCRDCGIVFDNEMIKKMKENINLLAKDGLPSLIFLSIFVLLAILFSIAIVR